MEMKRQARSIGAAIDGTEARSTATPNLHSRRDFETYYGGRRPEFYSGLLATIIREGQPGRIIDLGAGLGLFVELAHCWNLHATGLEGSTFAVNQARERAPGIEMLVHDLADPLPFGDDEVANVVLNQVIEHIDEDRFRKTLVECHRVLRKGGALFIFSPSRKNLQERREPTHINMMLASELRSSLENAGFRVRGEPNAGVWFMPGDGRVARTVSYYCLRYLPHDWVSATANAIATKP